MTAAKRKVDEAIKVITEGKKFAGIAIVIDVEKGLSDSACLGPSDLVVAAVEELLLKLHEKYQPPSPRFLSVMAAVMLRDLGENLNSVDVLYGKQGNS